MLSERFQQFLSSPRVSSEVANVLLRAWYTGHLDFSVASEVDVNDSFQLVYRTPGKEKRQVLRPGKLPALLLPSVAFDSTQLEAFVNDFKVYFSQSDEFYIEVVSGEDIAASYETYNYDKSGDYDYDDDDDRPDVPLWRSCMNDDIELLGLYTSNPGVCRLVRMRRSTGTEGIVARALLWNTIEGETILDRIYWSEPRVRDLMKNWAKEQGYLHKYEQDAQTKADFYDPQGKHLRKTFSVQLDAELPSEFPYVDTFTWLLPDKRILTNECPPESQWYYQLTSTGGSFSEHTPREMVYSTYHGQEIDRHGARYSEIIQSWITSGCYVEIDGQVYPEDHDDICRAYTIRRMNSYPEKERTLKSRCLQTPDGTWFEKGHPWFLYRHQSREWSSPLKQVGSEPQMYEPVTNAYGEEGLYNGSFGAGGLLPMDTEILEDIHGRRFVRGDSTYGYYYMPGRSNGALGWARHYEISSYWRAMEVPEGTTLEEAQRMTTQAASATAPSGQMTGEASDESPAGDPQSQHPHCYYERDPHGNITARLDAPPRRFFPHATDMNIFRMMRNWRQITGIFPYDPTATPNACHNMARFREWMDTGTPFTYHDWASKQHAQEVAWEARQIRPEVPIGRGLLAQLDDPMLTIGQTRRRRSGPIQFTLDGQMQECIDFWHRQSELALAGGIYLFNASSAGETNNTQNDTQNNTDHA